MASQAMDQYGPNPYQTAGNPGMYAGSGYAGDQYATAGGGYQQDASWQQGGQQGPEAMGTGVGAGADVGQDNSYQRYIENSGEKNSETIDPETGVAPRRLTDCVCLPIFFLYMVGMFVVTGYANSNGNIERLTHGYDYAGRLCGTEDGANDADPVADKRYLFWCRLDPAEKGVPSELNLADASCVKQCPFLGGEAVTCLRRSRNSTEPGMQGVFGTVESRMVHLQQSIVKTRPYATEPFGGRFCLPAHAKGETWDEHQHVVGLRSSVLHGPKPFFTRLVNSSGSFASAGCWLMLFMMSVIACALSFIFMLGMKFAPKQLLWGQLWIADLLIIVIGLTFTIALFFIQDGPWNKWPGVGPMLESYKYQNPFFQRNVQIEAAIYSSIVGIFFLVLGFIVMYTIRTVETDWIKIADLVKVSMDFIFGNKHLFIFPFIIALFKFLSIWMLMSNMLTLFTVGWIDGYRVEINGVAYEGPSKLFHYAWSTLPAIVYYIFGFVWIVELLTSLWQFILSFTIIEWYFTAKVDGQKMPLTNRQFQDCIITSFTCHFGSLILGAALIPWFRIPRTFDYVLWGNLPDPNSHAGCCACFWRNIGACCLGWKKCAEPTGTGGVALYTSLAWNDVIIRSNHFFPSAEKAMAIIKSAPQTKNYNGRVRIVTFVGVTGVGFLCSAITYSAVNGWEIFRNPTSSQYIEDPLAVAHLAFWLCGGIAYSYTMLLDHTADVLLYCYAWNNKYKKSNVDKYVPDDLRSVVGVADKNADSYPLYGNAPSNMYLSTWSTIGSAGPAPKAKPKAPMATPTSSQTAQQYYGGSQAAGYGQDQYAGAGGYPPQYGGGSQTSQYAGYPTAGYGQSQAGGGQGGQGYLPLEQHSDVAY